MLDGAQACKAFLKTHRLYHSLPVAILKRKTKKGLYLFQPGWLMRRLAGNTAPAQIVLVLCSFGELNRAAFGLGSKLLR